jgi:hypothetical protein
LPRARVEVVVIVFAAPLDQPTIDVRHRAAGAGVQHALGEEQAQQAVVEVHPVEIFSVVRLARPNGQPAAGMAVADMLKDHR